MDYYCVICDKLSEVISKRRHLKSLTHNELGNFIRRKHNNRNPDFFDKDRIFNEFITYQKKSFHLYHDKYDFKLVFEKTFILI